MIPGKYWQEFRALIGLERNTTSHAEKLISLAGGLTGILAVYYISTLMLDNPFSQVIVLGPIGASAVLLFAVPQGALSQPWQVIGGNFLAAAVGVTCYKFIPDTLLSASVAVALAIGVMHYLRCLHPPGGATALTAVIGGDEIHDLGYSFLFEPVLINVLVIVAIAIMFNYAFHWRRYPAHLAKRHKRSEEIQGDEREYELTQEDFAAAMQQLDSYIDVTSDGLTELLELAKQHAAKSATHPRDILPGHFYSNGKLGRLWSVREVIDQADIARPDKDMVTYKVVAGHGAYETALCLRGEFRQWARFEVVLDNGRWVKVLD
jgi:CBS domain-containing membrane protein